MLSPFIHLGCRLMKLHLWTRGRHYFKYTNHLTIRHSWMCKSLCTSSRSQTNVCLIGEKDRFNAITVDLGDDSKNSHLAADVGRFSQVLRDSSSKWQEEGAIAIWLKVPILQSGLIPMAADQGFTLHHTDGDCTYLSRWLLNHCPNRLPAYANHQIGVSGFVLNEEKHEVLMVQDRHRIIRWKFPGGLSNFQEDIPDTAVREVMEETGIKTEFQSILCFRQQHNMPWAYGISDIYIICRLRPLTFDINICKNELIDAKWTDIDDLLRNPEHTAMTVRVAKLIKHGLSHGFHTVDITMDELSSPVYKNTTYKIFHKPLPS